MKKVVIGLLMILAGIVGGLYFGVWWALIGGIVDVIQGAVAADVDAMKIAFGVAKFMFSGVIGWLVFVIFVIPGAAIIEHA